MPPWNNPDPLFDMSPTIPTELQQEKILSEPMGKRIKGSFKRGLRNLSKRFRKNPKSQHDPSTFWYHGIGSGRKKSRKPKRTKKLKKRTRKPKRTKKRTRRP